MKLKVLYHDRCFDGLSSAAVFSRFYREKVDAQVEISYQGLAHQAGEVFPPGSFSGDENAVVDFRYSSDPRLTWWFDHHRSAFPTPEDRKSFEADRSGKKFFAPEAKSCTKFLCDTLVARFGFDARPLAELVHWAEIIDGALFPDAASAVELREPALQLMLAIEASQDEGARHRLIGEMQRRPLAELVSLPEVRQSLEPALAAHRATLDIMKREARLEGSVVTFDLLAHGLETFNKFISYYLFPEAAYSVGVTGGPSRTKISVGSDPWHPGRRRHDLSKICEQWGGGGHAVVAAISFPPGQADRARQAAREIVAELNR
ncbi:MAG: DHH family phosphoesterase [Myxococcales bacterium]